MTLQRRVQEEEKGESVRWLDRTFLPPFTFILTPNNMCHEMLMILVTFICKTRVSTSALLGAENSPKRKGSLETQTFFFPITGNAGPSKLSSACANRVRVPNRAYGQCECVREEKKHHMKLIDDDCLFSRNW